MDLNAAGGSEAGASDEKIAALPEYRTSPLFSEAEQVALELADAASQLPAAVTDELFARAREHYSERELVELGAIISLENFRSRFNRIFDVEPHGLYCPVPQRAATKGSTAG